MKFFEWENGGKGEWEIFCFETKNRRDEDKTTIK